MYLNVTVFTRIRAKIMLVIPTHRLSFFIHSVKYSADRVTIIRNVRWYMPDFSPQVLYLDVIILPLELNLYLHDMNNRNMMYSPKYGYDHQVNFESFLELVYPKLFHL